MRKNLYWLFTAMLVIFLFAAGSALRSEAAELKSVTTHAADGSAETHDYRAVTSITEANTGTDYVYLSGDLQLGATYRMTDGQQLYVDLEGHTLSMAILDRFVLFNGAANAKLVITNGKLDMAGVWPGTAGSAFYVNGEGSSLIFDNVVCENGVNNDRYFGVFQPGSATAEIHFFDTTIRGCTGGSPLVTSSGTIRFHSGIIENCVNTGYDGGGAVGMFGSGVFYMDGGTFRNCTAPYGGAVYIEGGTFYMNGGMITGNEAVNQGGAFYVYKGSLNLLGGTVGGSSEGKNRAANIAGAVMLYSANASCLVDGTEISYNEAPTAGQFSVQAGAELELKSGLIKEGRATAGIGGNLHVIGGSEFSMSGGTIANGNAKTNGGNIAITSDFTMAGGTITGGTAEEFGGNISFNAADLTFTMTDGTISEGKAIGYWGGNIAFNNSGAVFAMSGGTITGGQALSSYGGNICFYQAGSSIEISGTAVISDGAAGSHSGNIYCNNTEFLMSGGTIANGTAVYWAGNMDCIGRVSISGGSILGGVADNAGSILVEGEFSMEGGLVSGGKAITHGGNIYVLGNSPFTLIDGTIIEGTGANGGTKEDIYLGSANTVLDISGGGIGAIVSYSASAPEGGISGGFYNEAPAGVLLSEGFRAFAGSYSYEGNDFSYYVTDASEGPMFDSTISGAISERFALNFRVKKGTLTLSSMPFLRISRNGTDTDITDYSEDGDILIFTVCLDPVELTDNLCPRVILNGDVVDQRAVYSAATYIKALAESSYATDKMKTLLADLLEYGAAAQLFLNYHTDDLANDDSVHWAGYAPSVYSAPASVPEMNYSAGDASVTVKSANLRLEEDTIRIQFRGIAPEDAVFTLNGVAVAAEFVGSQFLVKTEALKMSEITDAVFTFTVGKGSVSSGITYGVAAYITRITNSTANDAMRTLAERIWMYGLSAKAFY